MDPDVMTGSMQSGGLSLYANLLDHPNNKGSAPGTISRAAVVFKQLAGNDTLPGQAVEEKQHINAASLRFQPTKRPQLSAQKLKSKTPLQKGAAAAPSSASASSEPASTTARPLAKTTLADWTAEKDGDDINGFYGGEKRQRGGRKKRKKEKEDLHVLQNWEDIYDPSRPNNYDNYKHSDEKTVEIREWKDKLYVHRMERGPDSGSDISSDQYKLQITTQNVPPGMTFAPPPILAANEQPQSEFQAVDVPNDSTDEAAFARRVGLLGCPPTTEVVEPPSVIDYYPSTSTLSQPPPSTPGMPDPESPSPALLHKAAPASSISRAPVRYNLPSAPPEIPASEAELENALLSEEVAEEMPSEAACRSLRPGQKGFAERLMSKYGWSKGSGLGVRGSGIVNPLRVHVEKQKKKPDSEGGGFVGPGGRGKIIGGKKKAVSAAESEEGKFGIMSEVIVLRGMVDGMDLDTEMERSGNGGLMQEIGDECGDKYGRVERVFIDRSDATKALVFIKFTSQLSALRAVNALEGRIFNGNRIEARFFDADKFDTGVFE